MLQDSIINEQSTAHSEISDAVELQVGHIVKGIVKSCHKKFIIVLLGTKECYLPVSEVSWTNKKMQLKEKDEIEAVVLKINENGSVMLSIKRLQDDPWKKVQDIFYVGMKVKGSIQRVLEFGLSIDIGNSITALLHKKTIGFEKGTNFFDYILLGNMLEVEITEIDMESRKVYLKCDNFLEQYPKRNK
jgi:ribosomal protein S1